MTADTHQTAPTQFVEANGVRFAYRRFGKTGGVPLAGDEVPHMFTRKPRLQLEKLAINGAQHNLPQAEVRPSADAKPG